MVHFSARSALTLAASLAGLAEAAPQKQHNHGLVNRAVACKAKTSPLSSSASSVSSSSSSSTLFTSVGTAILSSATAESVGTVTLSVGSTATPYNTEASYISTATANNTLVTSPTLTSTSASAPASASISAVSVNGTVNLSKYANQNAVTMTVSTTASAGSTLPTQLFANATASATTITSTATASNTAVTVALDGSAQFTAINAAIAYAQASAIPTVSVLAGTYTEAVTIAGTAAVTIAGPQATSYAANSVTVSQPGLAVTYAKAPAAAVWRNIDFAATDASQKTGAVYLRGGKNAFYGCSFTCAGTVCLTGSYAAALIADSYIEGPDKLLYAYPSFYLFRTTVVPTASGASVVYNQGATIGSTLYNSTVVFDSCAISQKSGLSNTNVYLAAANSAGGSVALWRNTSIAGFVAATGVHVDAKTQSSGNVYTEFVTSGSGAYVANAAARAAYVTKVTDGSLLANYALQPFFSGVTPSVASTDVSWIDTDIVSAIGSSDAAQAVAATAVVTTSSIIPTTTAAANITIAANATTTAANVTIAVATATAIYTVAPTPTTGQFGSVQSAVNALPADGAAYTIYILAGNYTEQISINRTGKVTLRGETTFTNDYTQNKVTLSFSYGLLTSLGRDEDTPVISARKSSADTSGLALYNINFVNTFPQTSNTAALAADFYGKNMAAYGCSFIGFQDTLLANQGTQVFSNCYIEGSVDFVWGYSKAYFHQCYVASNTGKGASITAQNRPSASWAGGFVFDHCYVTYTESYGSTMGMTYLGRPWSSYAVSVFRNSYLDSHINSAGWSIWSTSAPQTSNVFFGEYNNSGPGAWTSSTERASFATNMTAEAAAAYDLSTFLGDVSWLDSSVYGLTPSYPLEGSVTVTTTNTTNTTSYTWAVPTSGTTPPTGAVLVCANGSIPNAFTNLTDALASLPSDSSAQAIFIYPGTYNEQVPSISRSGSVMLIGYTEQTPGANYSGNMVTVTNGRGLSVSPLPAGHSDAETATMSTGGKSQISLYNINIINSANLDGSQASYVTLAASLYGNHVGLYGCSMIGWQDTLLTGATSGNMYFESSYISGAIDFIWGYSAVYFKGCTIAAKRAKSCVTAHNRASATAIGAYVFDQCLFTAATTEGYSVATLQQSVYLGRPYNSYARVVVKQSYLSSIIAPAGWKQWSKTVSNLDHVTFAEYNNSGPGNWENNAAAREAFGSATLLTNDSYPLASVLDSTSWVDLTRWSSIQTPVEVTTTTTTTTAYNGTVPPSGAFIVSKTPIENVTTYSTIQDALNALPASSSQSAIVFIYPGSYYEQLVLNKSGSTTFMGYSNNTGDYKANQVTITYDHGIDTQADQSNSDGATVYATGNIFKAININFANTFGNATNYASLGFAVRSSKYASLYQCAVTGSQDALLINGNLFMSNSYVEGSIDMIWGSGRAYFLNTTVTPLRDGISLTADKRSTNTTDGGFVFDQCTVAAGSTGFTDISLGRPWNNFARVAYIESYLGSSIQSAGWDQWSKSTPNTDGVLFGEFANYGPGSDVSQRASFSTQLTADTAAQFQLQTLWTDISWIDTTLLTATPFVAANVTVVTTVTSTITVTGTTTVTAPASATATLVDTATQTLTTYSTVTPAASSTVVDVEKTTVTEPVTVSIPGKTSTVKTTITTDIGATVTPAVVTATTTIKSTVTVTGTETSTAKASTVKITSTTTQTVTSSAKATTVKVTVSSVITSVVTAKPSTLRSTSTVIKTVGNADATTTTLKAATTSVTVAKTTIKTVKKTTTLSCVPTQARRSFEDAVLQRRDAAVSTATSTGSTTIVYATSTAYITVTATASTTGYAATTTTTVPVTVDGVTTLKPGKTTVFSTAVVTETETEKETGTPVIVLLTSTKTIGKTTTLDASTVTQTVSAVATRTAEVTETVTVAAVTSTKLAKTRVTVRLAGTTVTRTVSKTTKIKSTITPEATTQVKTVTLTQSLHAASTVTVQSTVTKTKTVKAVETETVWATKTAKNAPTCS